ncbi:aminodeoxychorismate lyase [Zhongshania sp. BJYM1]|uniref:aminodeoxychorismate lyase n=1 Tax=Zhongshania aquatica TaxID=2965069 RepID=UPI0022B2AECF|nr:aminodeoxychorismate lyase [Marortus sp. BJYM1]
MSNAVALTLYNGRFSQQVGAESRGLAYGDGIFETVLVRGSRPLWLEEHLQRLASGAKQLGIPCDLVEIRRDCTILIASLDTPMAVLKIVLCRGHVSRGYTPHLSTPDRVLSISPYSQNCSAWNNGIALAVCQTQLSSQTRLAGIKHLNRLEQVLAAEELLKRGYQEGLMMHGGRIIEASRSNVFFAVDGELVTPSLGLCGVSGIMRQQVLKHAANLAIPTRVCDLGISLLQQAEEVFVCNSVFGLWPVTKVECVHKEIGPISRLLQREFDSFFYV